MNQLAAIENLYSVFRRYTTSDMFYCDCGCIDLNDVKKLASKPLRVLEEDDLSAYHGSALYTWGNLEHYKHFLPRILEVYHLKHGQGLVNLYEITTKLKHAKWETWAAEEVKAIRDFMCMDWSERVHHTAFSIEKDDLKYYTFFFKIKDLIELWEITESEVGLKKLVNLLYDNGEETFYQIVLKNIPSISHLTQKLEKTFFEVVETDNEYSERISIVLQMIETILAIGKVNPKKN